MVRQQPIYLDYQATTPVDPRVFDAMLPYFSIEYGNPHADSHEFGWAAQEAVEGARRHVASAIGARPAEIIFTSGATEANNLALHGFVKALGPPCHIVTTAIEHPCVLETCRELARHGYELTIIPVTSGGIVDLDTLAAAVRPDTSLVSVMAINNEIGTIQPLAEIGQLCRMHGAAFHVDAAQAPGRIALDVDALSVDLMSLSGHKIYGPKGIGALYVRRWPLISLAPLMHGGGQERGLRPGTLPVPLCVGFGEAISLAVHERESEGERLALLRSRLLDGLTRLVPDIYLNGDHDSRISGNINIRIPGVAADALLARLPDLALGTGSACSSAVRRASHVLMALGLSEELALSSIRIGIGRPTTMDDIDLAVRRLGEEIRTMRGANQPC